MKVIYINSKKHGSYEVLVDDEDYEELIKYKWGITKIGQMYYARRDARKSENFGKYAILIHKQILNLFDKASVIDHIDHNGLNNQKNNLRICTRMQNCRNRRIENLRTINSTSKHKGVGWNKRNRKWRARIVVNKKDMHIGFFKNELEAAKAYDKTALKYFGEFACLNFPELIDEYRDENK